MWLVSTPRHWHWGSGADSLEHGSLWWGLTGSWLVLVTVTNGSLMVSQSGRIHKEGMNAQQDRRPPRLLLTRVAVIRLMSPTAHVIRPRGRVPMPVLPLRRVVSLEASRPATPALLILFSFVNPLHCPALCFSFCSCDPLCSCCLWKGNFASSAIPGPPFRSCSKCPSSLFCVPGFLPDTTGTVNWTDNFPAVRDVSSQWERQSPMQINKVPLVVVFIILWMYVH